MLHSCFYHNILKIPRYNHIMHFALHRNSGEPISIDSPEAPLVFKYYGTLQDNYVRIDTSVQSLWLDPDTNQSGYCQLSDDAQQPRNCPKIPINTVSDLSVYTDTSLTCTITGEHIMENSLFHITEEGHAYSQSGLNILFSCGKSVAKSPYMGSPVIKRSDLKIKILKSKF